MASSINASTSGAGGVITTADNTGILNIQTAGTNAVTVDASQNVGIGTSSPTARLHIYGSGTSGYAVFQGSSANQWMTLGGNFNEPVIGYTSTGALRFGTTTDTVFGGFTERMRLTGGSLCIGTTTPNSQFLSSAARLTVGQWGLGPTVDYGNFYLQNSSGVGVQLTSGSTSWAALSDERLKTDLKPIENAANKVATLRAVTGRYIKDEHTISRSFLIAQDVQKVLPEAVGAGEDEDQTLQLKYTEVIPLLVAAIKELKAEIDILKGASL
jgi:hypothetical protein